MCVFWDDPVGDELRVFVGDPVRYDVRLLGLPHLIGATPLGRPRVRRSTPLGITPCEAKYVFRE